MFRIASLVIALALLTAPVKAELQQINRFSFAQRRPSWTLLDLRGRFEEQSLAVTPAGDFLSFSPRRDGVWELYRVTAWNTNKPAVDHLLLPGYFSWHDQHDLEMLAVNLYVTPGGDYAVCSGTAEWLKRVNGRAVGRARMNSIITVIDLSTFKVINSVQTKAFNLLEFSSVALDRKGRILIESSSFKSTADKPRGEFLQLDVPSLHASPKCVYDNEKPDQLVSITTRECSEDLGTSSLEDYLKTSSSYIPIPSQFVCSDTTAEYCPQPDRFTPDNLFGLGMLTEGHDNFLGSWVQTRATAILFSTKTHLQIGELDLTHQSHYLELASMNGKDYLLVLRAGSELTVYQLIDPDFSQTQ